MQIHDEIVYLNALWFCDHKAVFNKTARLIECEGKVYDYDQLTVAGLTPATRHLQEIPKVKRK